MSGQPFVHPGPAKLMAEAQEFLIEEGIITRTALDTMVRLTKERDAALATIGRVRTLIEPWEQKAPTCPCEGCRKNRNHAAAIRAALAEPL